MGKRDASMNIMKRSFYSLASVVNRAKKINSTSK